MSKPPYRILSLDGGGSLGMYTLGVLTEIEKALPIPLYQTFDLIYGTSTGAIIGSMIALGFPAETVTDRYLAIIPDVMGRWQKWSGKFGQSVKVVFEDWEAV